MQVVPHAPKTAGRTGWLLAAGMMLALACSGAAAEVTTISTPASPNAAVLAALKAQDWGALNVARIQQRLADMRGRRGSQTQSAPAVLDTTAPVLTSVTMPTRMTFDVRLAEQQFVIGFSATDELSGVAMIQATAKGPTGTLYTFTQDQNANFPLQWSGQIAWNADMAMPPGRYDITQMCAYDYMGNARCYDSAALKALGASSTKVKVSNAVYDAKAPVLVQGTLLTPTVSLSAVHPGAAQVSPMMAAQLSVTDSGGGIASGVASANMLLCNITITDCFESETMGMTGVRGKTQVVLPAGTQTMPATTGTYYAVVVVVRDFAGNMAVFQDTLFGGRDNFNVMFPAGKTVTIVP